VIYLDTSALVKLVFEETESAALARWLYDRSDVPKLSAEVATIELVRTCRRNDEAAVPAARELLAGLDLIPLTGDLVESAALTGPVELRSLDVIHLASASAVAEGITAFVVYDVRLTSAASELGCRWHRRPEAAYRSRPTRRPSPVPACRTNDFHFENPDAERRRKQPAVRDGLRQRTRTCRCQRGRFNDPVGDVVRLRPIEERDIDGLLRFFTEPGLVGEFQWFGFRAHHALDLRRRWEQDRLSDEESFLAVSLEDGSLPPGLRAHPAAGGRFVRDQPGTGTQTH
jgi:uncharacterized protein